MEPHVSARVVQHLHNGLHVVIYRQPSGLADLFATQGTKTRNPNIRTQPHPKNRTYADVVRSGRSAIERSRGGKMNQGRSQDGSGVQPPFGVGRGTGSYNGSQNYTNAGQAAFVAGAHHPTRGGHGGGRYNPRYQQARAGGGGFNNHGRGGYNNYGGGGHTR
uniref:Uncharacterized protein n=1 Tax=Arundo donax TaxID=35708 RepID=A0A0A9BE98_ARUDO